MSGPYLDPTDLNSRVYLIEFDSVTEGSGRSFWVSAGHGSGNSGPDVIAAVRDAMEASSEFSNVAVRKSQTGQEVLS